MTNPHYYEDKRVLTDQIVGDLGLIPKEHAGIRVVPAMNGFVVHLTADANFHPGATLVARSHNELKQVLVRVQDQQRQAMLDYFDPAKKQPSHETAMRKGV
jgi:hypothetical protein